MSLKKRITAIMFCLVILFGISPDTSAAGQTKIIIGTVSGKPGDIVKIPVNIKENPGLIGFSLSITFDSKRVMLTSVEQGPLLKSEIEYYGDVVPGIIQYQLPKYIDDIENEDMITKDGVLFYINFLILESNSDKIKIPVEFEKGWCFVYQKVVSTGFQLTRLPLAYEQVNGSISIEKALAEDAIYKEQKFTDLTGTYASVAEYVEYLADKGIIGGVGNGKFAPEKNVKRGDFVKMLAGVSGVDFSGDKYVTDQFSDVAKSHSYNKLIGWASATGIVTGYGDKTFKMDNNITREDMAVMVYRLAQHMKVMLPKRVDLKLFSDDGEISSYAKEAVTALQQADIVGGSEFKSKVPATRADAAKMLALYMKLYS